MYGLRASFLEAYQAELQLEAFASEEIARLMSFARQALRGRLPVWNLPLEWFAA